MEHQTLIFLSVSFLSLAVITSRNGFHVSATYDSNYRNFSSSKLQRIQEYLDKINKPPVLTIESPDGDIIDCVDKRKQLAFDHPLLKNHKIQDKPPEMPKMNLWRKQSMLKGAWQLWHTNGTLCPKDTIPVRRTTFDDINRESSIFKFGQKRRRLSSEPPNVLKGVEHQHVVGTYEGTAKIYGAKATINVWNPEVKKDAQAFSLSQIWIVSQSSGTTETIEAGWQVYPFKYKGGGPRIFVYWTNDSYQTGCYNHDCSGFVQTSQQTVLGAAINSISSYGGVQHELTYLIWKDPNNGNWWLSIDEEVIGYWPSVLYTHLRDNGETLEFGGEITNIPTNGRHTSTQMGSGHFPEEGFKKASYFRNLEIVGPNKEISPINSLKINAEAPTCYNIYNSYDEKWGAYFFYGGPGYNPKCP